ncbi:MAG: hypothetical protein KDB53_21555, partial [Planctomycetes bacterium]|nr:hypothetical protein [Planctomycetota bacterium]
SPNRMNRVTTCLLLLACALPSAAVEAQTLTLNSATARMTVNGQQAQLVSPTTHQLPINVTSQTTLALAMTSTNVGAGIILLASPINMSGPVLNVPWGASLDVGTPGLGTIVNVVGVVDGIGFTVNPLLDLFARTNSAGSYTFTGSLSPGFSALADPSIAFQAIMADPTNVPLPLRNTAAADCVFFNGPLVTTYLLGDDDWAAHSLVNPITFCGQARTQIFINSNGFLTFANGQNDWEPDMPKFFNGFRLPMVSGANPGVALAFADLNTSGSGVTGSTYDVAENLVTGNTKVTYRNQLWWGSNFGAGAPAGDFSAEFGLNGPGSVTLDYTNFITDTDPHPLVVGLTNGTNTVGPMSDLSAAGGFVAAIDLGGYSSPAINDSVGELTMTSLWPPTNAMNNPLLVINAVDNGNCNWFIF